MKVGVVLYQPPDLKKNLGRGGVSGQPKNPSAGSGYATDCQWARWPSGLERWTGDRTVRGSNPTAENFSLRNFGNSVYPALPVSFGGDTKRLRSLLYGVYARGSKRPHQSALECVTVVDSTAHSKLPQKCVYAAENAALH